MLALYCILCFLFIAGAFFLAFDEKLDFGAILMIIATIVLIPTCLYTHAEREEYMEGYNNAIMGKGIGVPADSDGTSSFERGFKDGIRDAGTPENARF